MDGMKRYIHARKNDTEGATGHVIIVVYGGGCRFDA